MRVLIAIVVLLLPRILWAHEGWGIALDPDGQVYFADVPTNTIWKIGRNGKLVVAASNQHTHAIGADREGNIWGAHENGSVWRIAPDGRFHVELPSGEGFPLSLHAFISDDDGSIYSMNAGSVQSGRVTLLRRLSDGRVSTIAGSTRGHADGFGTAARFTSVDGMAWAPDGSLYITDEAHVRRVTKDGQVSTIAGPLTDERWDEDLMGLTVLANGKILVADYTRRRILEIAPDGTIRTITTARWPWAPTGVVLRGSDLYILEHLRSPLVLLGNLGIGAYVRVRKLSADGSVLTLATVWGRHTRMMIKTVMAVVLLLSTGRLVRIWIRRSHAN